MPYIDILPPITVLYTLCFNPCRTFILFAIQALLGAAAAIRVLLSIHEERQRGLYPHAAAPSSSSGFLMSMQSAVVGPSSAHRPPSPAHCPAASDLGSLGSDGRLPAAAGETSEGRLIPMQQHYPTAALAASGKIREFTGLEKLFLVLFVTVLCNELAIMVFYCGYRFIGISV